jgi:hypothetical protein
MQSFTNKRTVNIICFILLIFGFVDQAFAKTYTMNCAEYGAILWSNPSSWQPNGIPGADDDVIVNCSTNAFIATDGDVTVKTLTIDRIGYIFGPGVMTVTERIETKFPFFWQMKLVIGPNATGLMKSTETGINVSQINFYDDLTVNGSLTLESYGFSGYNLYINGTLTQKEGILRANTIIKPGGVLNIDSPILDVELSTMNNQGTINWRSGNLTFGGGGFTNSGTFNVLVEKQSLAYTGFIFQDFAFTNTGTVNIAANTDSLTFFTKFNNLGSIVMNGPTALNMYNLKHSGTIVGPSGSSLNVSGYNNGAAAEFTNGSVVDVPRLTTMESSSTKINQGCNISSVSTFNFGRGPLMLDVALPEAATYIVSADIQTSVDQKFTGDFQLYGGSFNGDVSLLFDTPNLKMSAGSFGGFTKVKFSPTTIAQVQGMGVSDLINDGTINVLSEGYLSISLPGLLNNGNINCTGQRIAIYGYSSNTEVSVLSNVGTLNINANNALLSLKLENTGVFNIGANDTIGFSGELIQKGKIIGQVGSKLSLGYTITEHSFNNGSVTQGLDELQINFGTTSFKTGAILNDIDLVSIDGGTLQTSIVLPPTFKYTFNNGMVRLNTTFEPSQTLDITDTDIEGSGNIKINNALNWFGGTLDVPIRINDNATVVIHEKVKRPIISSPFTNSGNVTLGGGIIEINTGFFKNAGNWNIDSDEDVIIDGFTSFTNQGTFSICGLQPIKVIFNVPFINTEIGTFKGDGSYTFNAGFTNEGTVAPGCSPGRLMIEDNIIAPKAVEIEVTGDNEGEYDELMVNGNMVAGEWLKVIVPEGFSMNGKIKIIETTGTFTGTFASVQMPSNFSLEYVPDGVVLSSDGTVKTLDENIYGLAMVYDSDNAMLQLSSDKQLPVDTKVTVFDVQGRLMLDKKWDNEEMLSLNLNFVMSGMYIININTLPTWSEKVIVLK